MHKILIIDDDQSICSSLKSAVEYTGHSANCSLNIKDALEKISSENYDAVFLDVGLPDGDGLDILPKIRAVPSNPEVIIITGNANQDGAELAIKNGAWDYIQKPFLTQDIILLLRRALQYRDEKKKDNTSLVLKREKIIGESLQIKSCLKQVAQAAMSDISVLITGKTGTGKELFAFAIHENSNRFSKNFVIVDCAALPETLVESILFGHVKGAFTGADREREGLIKQSDGGTLFLDEIGELPISMQKAFLRVLQERRFRPIGAKKEIISNFRLIAATNQDLNKLTNEGKFRQDLLFRIKSMVIDLPALKERKKDIKELAMRTMIKFCEREGIETKGFSSEFLKILEAYDWPGNVRELINMMEAAMSKAYHEPTLFPKHLPNQVRIKVLQSSINNAPQKKNNKSNNNIISHRLPNIKEFREKIIAEKEKEYLLELMSLTKGKIKEACQISGLGRARLYSLMKSYGILKSF